MVESETTMAESETTTPAKLNRRGRGKQKIEIKKVEKTSTRYVTFSKRKAGLFKKAAQLSQLTGADVGVVVFSHVGKLHSFGSPSFEAVIDRHLHCSSFPEEECFERLKEKEADLWWEKSTEEMGLEELQNFWSAIIAYRQICFTKTRSLSGKDGNSG